MQELKSKNYVDNIGVSIYGLKEGEAAIKTGIVDYIQLPYSILDQRGSKMDFFRKSTAKKNADQKGNLTEGPIAKGLFRFVYDGLQ